MIQGRKAGRSAGLGPVAVLAAGVVGAAVLHNMKDKRKEKRSSSRNSRADDYGRDTGDENLHHHHNEYRRDDRSRDRRY
jgi:hypothetical protein